jgi:hypothetical protein
MLHVKHYQNVAEPVMACSKCARLRPMVLFRAPRNTYTTVCQACRTEQEIENEAFIRKDCFWRNRRIVPLREKIKCGA